MNFRVSFCGRAHKYTQDEKDIVLEVMNNAVTLTQGGYQKNFQKKFANYIGSDDAFALNNATAALELTAQLCQFKKGDEFVCPSHTFTSSAYPFIKKGAIPVWADIDSDTHVITLESIKACVSEKTKAVVAVHLYGFIIDDIEEIAAFCKSNGIFLIEDAAQSLGAEIGGKKAGAFSDFGVFSFHSHKNITTLGEGGMLIVKDKKYKHIIEMLRHNGHCVWNFARKDYWIPAMGNVDLPELDGEYLMPNNYCIGEAECALGFKLLERIDIINKEKRARAMRFIDEMYSVDRGRILKFHREDSCKHSYHLLVAEVINGKRDLFIRKMAEEKLVQCVVQYYPLNRYDLYKKLGFSCSNCSNADRFYDNMVSFPFNHSMSDDDFDYMILSAKDVLRNM